MLKRSIRTFFFTSTAISVPYWRDTAEGQIPSHANDSSLIRDGEITRIILLYQGFIAGSHAVMAAVA